MVGILAVYSKLPHTWDQHMNLARNLRTRTTHRATKPPSTLRHQQRLTPEQTAALLADYLAKMPIPQITAKYGIHRSTVCEIVSRHYDGKRRRDRQMTDRDVERAAELYSEGKSLVSVGEHFGLVASTIRRELLTAGVQLRPRRGRHFERNGAAPTSHP
jgi:hypothetical protein